MKILISTSKSKPEVDKVYWLKQKKQHIKNGRTITNWVTNEKAVRVTAIRGTKVMIKNAFGKTEDRAKGIELSSLGKQYKLIAYNQKLRPAPRQSSVDAVAKSVQLKSLKAKQKELLKALADVEKQIENLKKN